MTAKNWMGSIAIAIIALSLSVAPAQAVTIISDGFSGSGENLGGSAPDTFNLPGGAWVTDGYGGYGETTRDSGFASTALESSSTISIGSAGLYTKPSVLTVTAVLSPQEANTQGIGVGFWAAQGGGNTPAAYSFYGFGLLNNGRLGYYFSAWPGGDLYTHAPDLSVDWSGPAFDPNAYYTLSFTVDTSTEKLTAVSLSCSTADYSPLLASAATPFSDSNTAYLGIMMIHRGPGGKTGSFDSLLLTSEAIAVPEPSTLVLAVLGLVSFGLVRLRRNYGRS